MKSVSFYRIVTHSTNNFESLSQPITVNCTGYSAFGKGDNVRVNTLRKDFYLMFLDKGDYQVVCPTTERNMKPGDMIIFSPNTTFIYSKPQNNEMAYYWVHFTGSECLELLKKCGIETNRILTVKNSEPIKKYFKLLHDTFLTRDDLFDTDSANTLSLLLINIGRNIDRKTAQNNQNTKKLKASLAYIHSNISQNISVKQLAEMEFLSVSRYSTIFRETMGLSPQNYIILAKISHACELIRTTSRPIRDISQSVGYSDPHYFSRLFSKHMNISPSEYKKMTAKENIQ